MGGAGGGDLGTRPPRARGQEYGVAYSRRPPRRRRTTTTLGSVIEAETAEGMSRQ